MVSPVKGAKNAVVLIYQLYQTVLEVGSAILGVSLAVTTHLLPQLPLARGFNLMIFFLWSKKLAYYPSYS